jgi:hypothetical protein
LLENNAGSDKHKSHKSGNLFFQGRVERKNIENKTQLMPIENEPTTKNNKRKSQMKIFGKFT